MSILKGKTYYYITYKLKNEEGKFINRYIKEKSEKWKNKTFVQELEQELIEKDKELYFKILEEKKNLSLKQVLDIYVREKDRELKQNSITSIESNINKYINNSFNIEDKTRNCFNNINLRESLNKLYTLSSSNKQGNTIYNNSIRILKGVLDIAVSMDLVNGNDYAKTNLLLKYLKQDNKENKEEIKVWNYLQIKRFLNTFKEEDKDWHCFFALTYVGALRLGEVMALKWGDFNYSKKTININKSLNPDGTLTTPKNQASNALVDLTQELCDLLNDFQYKQKGTKEDRIFFKDKKINRYEVDKVFKKHTELAKLTPIHFHGLRHSMASLMINKGFNVLLVSKHLRHANTQQTLNTYSHLFPKITQDYMEQVFK